MTESATTHASCGTIPATMPRPLHDEDTKARAIALAIEHGPAEATRLLIAEGVEIKAVTLRSWCSRAGIATSGTEKTAAAIARLAATREERRERLADRMLELAEMSTERAQALIGEANLRDAIGLFTRAIHDHQLLIGAATARTEAITEPVIAAEEVLDEVAQRRLRVA